MKIAQFGTFDISNYGDLLFPLIVQRRMNSNIEAELQPVSPIGGKQPLSDGLPSISVSDFVERSQAYEGLIIGGGNIIRLTPSSVGVYAEEGGGAIFYSDLWLGAVRAARPDAGIVFMAPGIPEQFPPMLHDSIAELIKRSAYVSVRDEISRRYLLDTCASADISVVPDPAWEVDELWTARELDEARRSAFKKLDKDIPQKSIIFHFNKHYFYDKNPKDIAVIAGQIAKHFKATPVLLALGACHGDAELAHEVASFLSSEAIVIDEPASIKEFAAHLHFSTIYIGSSMHGFITASAFHIPAVCVANFKVKKFVGLQREMATQDAVVESWSQARDVVLALNLKQRRDLHKVAHLRYKRKLDEHWTRVFFSLKNANNNQRQQENSRGKEQLEEIRTEIILALFNDFRNKDRVRNQIIYRNEELTRQLHSLRNSSSWKVTEPLRLLSAKLPGTSSVVVQLMKKMNGLFRNYPSSKGPADWNPAPDLLNQIEVFNKLETNEQRRYVVFTAIAGRYDHLMVPDIIDPDIDYVCFTDNPINGYGVWQIRPMPYYHPDPTRMARHVKTHPISLFPEYMFAIWIDSNIVVRGDLKTYIDRVKNHGFDLGLIRHPQRDCIYTEALACQKMKKDNTDDIDIQVERYRKRGIPPHQGMFETNLLISNIHSDKNQIFYRNWWREIDLYSKRDQLSVGYAIDESGASWTEFMEPGKSCRDSHDFSIYPHKQTQNFSPPPNLSQYYKVVSPYDQPCFADIRDERIARIQDKAADIIVCVHNALEDVEKCLASVLNHLGSKHNLIIVNDKSNEETSEYLRNLSNTSRFIQLIDNEENIGYTRSANVGLRAATSDFRVLLNSDTIVPPAWLEKLMDTAYSSESIGIVGPMSNAASWQSIPDIRGQKGQTAINVIPEGITPEDIDLSCEEWSLGETFPIVPLVHGFCFGVKSKLIDKIGGFDEKNFPRFYGEENDFCFRAREAGFELVIATNTFIYHRKSRSIDEEERLLWMDKGGQRLREIHGADAVRLACKQMADHPLLKRMRDQASKMWNR